MRISDWSSDVCSSDPAYRYAFSGPARAMVSFNDGRFFHDLDLSSGAWTCTHLCGGDRYDGEFTALDADSWRVVWTVKGPRNDLVLDSTYRRRLQRDLGIGDFPPPDRKVVVKGKRVYA